MSLPALAAAALGILAAATIGAESESEDSLSSLKLDSESEPFFALPLAGFFRAAAGLETGLAAAGLPAAGLAAALPLGTVAGAALDTAAVFDLEALGVELSKTAPESELDCEESVLAFFLDGAAGFEAPVLGPAALLAAAGFAATAGLAESSVLWEAAARTFAAVDVGVTAPCLFKVDPCLCLLSKPNGLAVARSDCILAVLCFSSASSCEFMISRVEGSLVFIRRPAGHLRSAVGRSSRSSGGGAARLGQRRGTAAAQRVLGCHRSAVTRVIQNRASGRENWRSTSQ
jgi:hypothetical protein